MSVCVKKDSVNDLISLESHMKHVLSKFNWYEVALPQNLETRILAAIAGF